MPSYGELANAEQATLHPVSRQPVTGILYLGAAWQEWLIDRMGASIKTGISVAIRSSLLTCH
jgi:hypothetical protein